MGAFRVMALASTVAALLVTQTEAQLTNGSFEVPDIAAPFVSLTAPDQTIVGWFVSAGSLDHASSVWEAADGSQSIDLNGTSAGTISQELTPSPCSICTVTFALAGNPGGAPAVKAGTASAGGVSFPFTFDTTGRTPAAMGWVDQSFSFFATGDPITLAFTSTIAGAFGPAIDNIRLACADAASFDDGDAPDEQGYPTGITEEQISACPERDEVQPSLPPLIP